VRKEDPASCRFLLQTCNKYHPEDDPQKVETCSWLTCYFYKVVILKVVNLPLFFLQHKAMLKLLSHDISRLVLLTEVNFKHQKLQKVVLGW